jgi:curved DNA-binding protein CbpA
MAETGYRPRFGKDIRIKPDGHGGAPSLRPCASSGCQGDGAYRVPKSRHQLNEHIWFCLEHARSHNENWNYFAGMSDAEVLAFQNEAVTGHRPTWPLGKRAAHPRNGQAHHHVHDTHHVFGEDAEETASPRRERLLTRPQAIALEVLNLDATATLHQIKARYKELVKRFHPDANGGDRGAEERLKKVIQAYGVLRASGLT